jgi:hypothetical protein
MWTEEPEDGRSFPLSARYEIAQALELLGAAARPAEDVLLKALLNEKTPPGTHLYVARALGHLRDDADVIVPNLLELTRRPGDGYTRITNTVHALEALGMLGPRARAAVARVRELTQDDEIEIAEEAARALERIKGR